MDVIEKDVGARRLVRQCLDLTPSGELRSPYPRESGLGWHAQQSTTLSMRVMSWRSSEMHSYFAIASLTTSGETLPCLLRPESAATVTLSLSISKKRRSCSLVSERPKPSVPRMVFSPLPMYFSISCGYAMMLSETKTVTPSKSPRHSSTQGTGRGLSGFRRPERSHLTASRCSSPMLVALQISQPTSYSASISFAIMACHMMAPEPMSLTLCFLLGSASSNL
mmetsp:Transcript_14414/g.43119  ORF Transcript_14414/g.43119 Transcript_14414/m.43119 type:complete len:223 (+) Transcript_14414:356-1024(+)